MQGELCEDEVFSQQAVGLCGLHGLLRGRGDQTGFLVESWCRIKVINQSRNFTHTPKQFPELPY